MVQIALKSVNVSMLMSVMMEWMEMEAVAVRADSMEQTVHRNVIALENSALMERMDLVPVCAPRDDMEWTALECATVRCMENARME